jgi:hypothetical protein
MLYKVIYDRAVHEKLSDELAEATLAFYLEGLRDDRLQDPDKWADEFFLAWDEWIYKFAPIAKDDKWKAEREFRLVHELKAEEFSQIRFQQKKTTLGRYLPLMTTSWVKRRAPLLPVAKVMIGPGNHPAFTRVSVALLLEQMGYPTIPIEITQVAQQRP